VRAEDMYHASHIEVKVCGTLGPVSVPRDA